MDVTTGAGRVEAYVCSGAGPQLGLKGWEDPFRPGEAGSVVN